MSTTKGEGAVAPHEQYSELRLVLGGYKPLAAIEKAKDPTGYALAVSAANAGMVRSHQLRGEVLISKDAATIQRYLHLLDNGVADLGIKGYHRAMGAMFGYSAADIEAFIEAEIDCNCSKCTGV